jgi:DnaJ-class molecular chaperone
MNTGTLPDLPLDYYHVLGLEKAADDDAIKSAYRKLALKVRHPYDSL